jgi:hypothetical protein
MICCQNILPYGIIIKKEMIIVLGTETIAIICSSIVSITAVMATVHQTKIQQTTSLSKLYYEKQVTAYCEFLEATVAFDTHPTQQNYEHFLTTGQKAKMISSAETSEEISKFCIFCEKHASSIMKNGPAISSEFSKYRKSLEESLRQEIYCYRPKKSLSKRFSKRLRSIFRGLRAKVFSK